MEGCSQDMPDANEVQVVPKGSRDITGTVVREQFGAILNSRGCCDHKGPEKPLRHTTLIKKEHMYIFTVAVAR